MCVYALCCALCVFLYFPCIFHRVCMTQWLHKAWPLLQQQAWHSDQCSVSLPALHCVLMYVIGRGKQAYRFVIIHMAVTPPTAIHLAWCLHNGFFRGKWNWEAWTLLMQIQIHHCIICTICSSCAYKRPTAHPQGLTVFLQLHYTFHFYLKQTLCLFAVVKDVSSDMMMWSLLRY